MPYGGNVGGVISWWVSAVTGLFCVSSKTFISGYGSPGVPGS